MRVRLVLDFPSLDMADTIRVPLIKFLWAGCKDSHAGIPLMKWSSVCLSKKHGVLSVKNRQHMNTALLGKWLWELLGGEHSLWKSSFLQKHYLDHHKFYIFMEHRSHTSPIWKGILKAGSLLEPTIRIKLGIGQSTFFWLDSWCRPHPLKQAYPRIYRLARDK